MDPLVIDLPRELCDFVESSAIKSTWNDPADIVRHLIEVAHERWVEAIEGIAEEAIASGPSVPWDPSEIVELRQRLNEKYGAKKA